MEVAQSLARGDPIILEDNLVQHRETLLARFCKIVGGIHYLNLKGRAYTEGQLLSPSQVSVFSLMEKVHLILRGTVVVIRPVLNDVTLQQLRSCRRENSYPSLHKRGR